MVSNNASAWSTRDVVAVFTPFLERREAEELGRRGGNCLATSTCGDLGLCLIIFALCRMDPACLCWYCCRVYRSPILSDFASISLREFDILAFSLMDAPSILVVKWYGTRDVAVHARYIVKTPLAKFITMAS